MGRERRAAGLAGVRVAANVPIEPDVEPVRRVFGDDAGQRSRIGRADQDHPVRLQRLAEAEQRGFDIGHMFDHVVADHEIEAVRRKSVGLDVAEDRFLRVVVVADLVFVDIDHGDVGAPQHIERQEAGRAAAGLVDRRSVEGSSPSRMPWTVSRLCRASPGGRSSSDCGCCEGAGFAAAVGEHRMVRVEGKCLGSFVLIRC